MADVTTVTAKDGARKELPTTYLTSDEADLLRNYERWGEMNHLSASMKCRHCGGDMEVYVQKSIGLFCDCRVILWQA
jgi:hypothetical protein